LKDKAYNIGLILIIASCIACIVSYYLLIFGIPTFLVGVTLIFLSKRDIKTKLITTIIPLLLYFPLTFLFLSIYNYSTPKTILIPQNFNGTLRIVYEEECGSNYEKKDGDRILRFPPNGILVLNEDFDGSVNYHYYLVDELGNRTEINQILDYKE
jgi:hypothetical protein